jgi:predicted RNase H-like nuclease (RuvC/YqgF family)
MSVAAIQELAKQNAYLLEKVRLQKERIDALESRCGKLEESALLHDELETKVKAIFQKLNMLETNVQASTNIDTFETTSYNESRTARSVLGL